MTISPAIRKRELVYALLLAYCREKRVSSSSLPRMRSSKEIRQLYCSGKSNMDSAVVMNVACSILIKGSVIAAAITRRMRNKMAASPQRFWSASRACARYS